MTLTYRDRVVDAAATTGTGTFTLGGLPPAGFRDFTAFPDGATVRYTIVHENNTEWEVGEGVWTTSGATLTRVKVFASSNAGSLVNFTAGSKTISAGPVAADCTKPVFRARRASTQSVTANTWTKMQLSTEVFDTAGAFDSTTNYRFTPQVAGYYHVSGQVSSSVAATRMLSGIFKNGTQDAVGNDVQGTAYRSTVSAIVYLNGSTDYVELWGFTSGTSFTPEAAADFYFAGALIAPAP
jgi:hypothetical protein